MASARGVGAVRALLVLALACVAALGSGVEARRDGSRLFQVGVRGRTLAELEDLGGVELKQEQMRMELQDGLKTMRKERKAIAGSGKKIEKVADEAEEISDKWRDIQVALLELYNVEPQTTPDDDDFYKTKVEEIRTHLASIYETAREAASTAGESVSLANDAADAFVDSEIKTEEGDLGAVAEMEDVEQDVAEVAQKAAEEGEEVAGEVRLREEDPSPHNGG